MSYGSLPGGRTLFLDLDGVMADFDGGFPAKFGFDHRKVADAVMWAAIEADGKFFRELPPCAGALKFYRLLNYSFGPVILTACPSDTAKFEDVATQKRAWVREHMSLDQPIVFTPGGKSKALYMNCPGDILIDDFERNIERWREAGGVGIHHTGDFNATWEQLYGAIWPKSQSAPGTSRAPSADLVTTLRDTTMDTASASAAVITKAVLPNPSALVMVDEEYRGPRC